MKIGNIDLSNPPGNSNDLDCWVIYDNPSDNPTSARYLMRRFIVTHGGTSVEAGLPASCQVAAPIPTKDLVGTDHLETLRKMLRRSGRIAFSRNLQDDPCIVETWL